ncbi:solute carrier family 2, facilitated glucose transporter member 5 isoform X3 [Hippocampus comes]|uniref:solute carrier family 2, facilitated glucose transporter member 5 isoform X3 n=1 Tax=Hippocampus comes TaxID=109280 RepID=UPI00094ECCE9|nr:PREDICTED: solute carrier family 2, facilitated glucose transporter member 5-like isoform X3 [Hippocampus comes]XP_019718661.1 PREDICTED: solute carrier family 2, facilitated glucose transporter member 5-like isoform X3 [Hippocampus comes]
MKAINKLGLLAAMMTCSKGSQKCGLPKCTFSSCVCETQTAMVETEELAKPERSGRLTVVLALATLVSTFGSSFQYGYNVAAINSPAPFMQHFYNVTFVERYGEPMGENLLTLLWSLSVSMYPLGGFFGSLMVAPLVNKLGRKGTLLFNNIFSIVPALMMGVSELAKSYEIIIVARFIVGICAGLSSNVVPMYLGELAPKNLRGAIGIVPQLFITIGILIAQVLGIRNILGNSTGWTLLLGITGIPAVIELMLLPFFPESPRYTLIQRGDEITAKKALQSLRGRDDVTQELSEMRLEDQSERMEGRLSVLSLLSQRSLRWQLVSIIVMNMGQQLSGVNAIYYYADSIYASAGVAENDIQYVTVGTGAVNVLMTVAAVFIVEASGRRLLLLCGFGICCGACVLLTVALTFQERVTWMPYVSITCVIIYITGHAIGPSPIPYVVTTEMFRQSARPAAFMVAGSVHWLSNFTVGLLFPFMERGLGAYSFIIFSFICLATLIYIWPVVPETKSKTFLEICQMFAKRNRVEIKLGDGPLKGSKENLQDAEKVTSF